jgi:RNA polymerase sigma-70 factor (ECF subfamily)
VNRPQEFVDDLVQEIVLKLFADKCGRLHEFSCAHPEAIEAYIKTIATNHAYDFFKAGRSQKRGGGESAQLLDTAEVKAELSSLGGVDAIQREILLYEIDSCLETNVKGESGLRDRTIFWLYYRQGMSANAIASIPSLGLGIKGVESVLVRVTRLLREKIAANYQPVAEDSPTTRGFGSLESY